MHRTALTRSRSRALFTLLLGATALGAMPATNRIIAVAILLCAISFFAPLPVWAVTVPTVPVGNAGNAGEVQPQGTFGAVAYNYRIGTTEVTNAQYAAFLNAKAASDPLALYNAFMGSDVEGGITQSGVTGSFSYAVKTNMGNKPVNSVSWYDAVRFANWLHNGQGSGDTETGAYTLLGGTPIPSNGLSITRNAGAIWFLPSEDEWYKAAYYDPTLNTGAGDYWDYPTQSNSTPTVATANSVGDISNPAANIANYGLGADWNSLDGNVTTVGSASPLSESYYGTSDQGGNVWEWNEALISGSNRGLRGGHFRGPSEYLLASYRDGSTPPMNQGALAGIRVAIIPEPGSGVLAIVACGMMWWWRKRFK